MSHSLGDAALMDLDMLLLHERMEVYRGDGMAIDVVRVPGGYLYITRYSQGYEGDSPPLSVSTSFVPRP